MSLSDKSILTILTTIVILTNYEASHALMLPCVFFFLLRRL